MNSFLFSKNHFKNTPNKKELQAKDKISFKDDPVGYIEGLSKSKKGTLNRIVYYSNVYGKVSPSQVTIANKANVTRETVNRNMREFSEQGILIKKYRPWQSCKYYLNPLFFDQLFRKTVSKILPYLKWLPKALFLTALLSYDFFPKPVKSKNVTLFNKTGSYIKKRQTKSKSILHKKEVVCCVKTNRKGGEKRYGNLTKGDEMLEKMRVDLKLTNYEASELGKFDSAILEKGNYILGKSAGIKHKFRYLLGICKKLEEESPKKKEVNTVIERKPRMEIKFPPKPRVDLSYDENLLYFGRWYEEHAENHAEYLKRPKEHSSTRFVELLNEMFKDPEKLAKDRKKAEEFRASLSPFIPANNTTAISGNQNQNVLNLNKKTTQQTSCLNNIKDSLRSIFDAKVNL